MSTIESVPDDALNEIMLRLATPAALIHAACASKRWRDIIAAQQFLDEYRKRHASSPFIGLYIPQAFGGLPSFRMADSIRPAVDGSGGDADVFRAAERASSLRGLGRHPEWRLLDCHNGRLLLARGVEAIEVYSPLSFASITVCLPQDDFLPEDFSACLLQGDGDDAASFRVVSVQHRRTRRIQMVRAIEYDSRTKVWTDHHPWTTVKNIELSQKAEVMHAGELIFCKCNGSSWLMLDTRSMIFSPLPLPLDNNPKHCAIGEMEDGVCCLASVEFVGLLNTPKLRVWKLQNLEWKLEKEMQVKQVLGSHSCCFYYSLRAVTNGIALLCSSKHQHFVIDLKTFSVKEKFQFEGRAAYPFQMPWPPTFSMAAGSDEQFTPPVVDIHQDMSASLAANTAHDGGQNYAFAAKNPESSKDNNLGSSQVNDVSFTSISLAAEIAHYIGQNHAFAVKNPESSKDDNNLGSSQVNNVSFTSITDFQDCTKFQQMDLRNIGDTTVAKEADAFLIPEQEVAGHAPYGTIDSGVQERDTLTHTDVERIKEIDYDGQYVECKLNTEDPLIPFNIDAVLLGCSFVNQTLLCSTNDNGLALAQKEECFRKENNVLDNYDLENLVPDQDLIPCVQTPLLMHLEVASKKAVSKYRMTDLECTLGVSVASRSQPSENTARSKTPYMSRSKSIELDKSGDHTTQEKGAADEITGIIDPRKERKRKRDRERMRLKRKQLHKSVGHTTQEKGAADKMTGIIDPRKERKRKRDRERMRLKRKQLAEQNKIRREDRGCVTEQQKDFPSLLDLENSECFREIHTVQIQEVATSRCGISPSEVTAELLLATTVRSSDEEEQKDFPSLLDLENSECFREIRTVQIQEVATSRCGISPSEVTAELLLATTVRSSDEVATSRCGISPSEVTTELLLATEVQSSDEEEQKDFPSLLDLENSERFHEIHTVQIQEVATPRWKLLQNCY